MAFVSSIMMLILLLPACSTNGNFNRRGDDSSTPHVSPSPHSSLPPQGVYESCAPSEGASCLEHLQQIAQGGFQLILNYNQLYGSEAQQLAYAARAKSLGIKIIWALSDPAFWNGTDLRHQFGTLAATCHCSDNAGFISYVVHLAKALPATWGYYVGDEVKPGNLDKMKAFADLVRQSDPSHPRLYISSEDIKTLGANLAPFGDTAEVLGADNYPVSTWPINTLSSIAHGVQTVANDNGKRSAMVLQAFSWSQYPSETWRCSPFPTCAHFPTQAEMREMRDLVLHNAHPALLLWYSYFNILRSDNPSGHWADLVQAAMGPS
jgi:hypothetical protein